MNKLEIAFLAFHEQNPIVFSTLKNLALGWKFSGKTKLGIAMLYERARWELTLSLTSTDDFKLNNNHRAFYARLLMRSEPQLAGLFNTRCQG
jgi:hypothetical protein